MNNFVGPFVCIVYGLVVDGGFVIFCLLFLGVVGGQSL